jgi:hypothetical protein
LKGLTVVSEGKRVNLRVYRRIFYPLKHKIDDKEYIINSDTGREIEISYGYIDYYGLDNPFNVLRLMRLARAMNCLRCVDQGENRSECRVTICMARELFDTEEGDNQWIPFDPKKMMSLDERIDELRRRARWRRRLSG